MDYDDDPRGRGREKKKSSIIDYECESVSETKYLTSDKKLSKRIIVGGDPVNWIVEHT